MAVNEYSIGHLYFAFTYSTKRRCPVHVVGVVETNEPWREGRAVALPCWRYRAFLVGVWVKVDHSDIDEEYSDDLWLAPHSLPHIELDEIAEWEDFDEIAKSQSEDEWDVDFRVIEYGDLPPSGFSNGNYGADGRSGDSVEQHLPLDTGVSQRQTAGVHHGGSDDSGSDVLSGR